MANRRRERTVGATAFRQRCLGLIDQVAETHVPLVVTKHGRPVVRVLPIDPPSAGLRDSVQLVAEDPSDYYSTGERWDVEDE